MKKFIITILIIFSVLPVLSLADMVIPPVSNAHILSGPQTAKLSWTNPLDSSFVKTIILRSTIPIPEYFTYEATAGLCDEVYHEKGENFLDKDLAKNLSYYYILYTQDKSEKYSQAIILEKKITEKEIETNQSANSTQINNNLIGATSAIVNEVSRHEAGLIYNFNKTIEPTPGSNAARLSLFIIIKSPHDLTSQDKNAISFFIASGTPTTIVLGTGERAGVLNSYLSVFNKLPTNTLEWQDIIKIANGRWPNERNIASEKKASDIFFRTIYQRKPNLNNAYDSAAITVIAYGLRPAQRNIASEKNAINIYRSIFKKSPVEATDWDLVRAIAYSGASR